MIDYSVRRVGFHACLGEWTRNQKVNADRNSSFIYFGKLPPDAPLSKIEKKAYARVKVIIKEYNSGHVTFELYESGFSKISNIKKPLEQR
jgi:hypothetical protein